MGKCIFFLGSRGEEALTKVLSFNDLLLSVFFRFLPASFCRLSDNKQSYLVSTCRSGSKSFSFWYPSWKGKSERRRNRVVSRRRHFCSRFLLAFGYGIRLICEHWSSDEPIKIKMNQFLGSENHKIIHANFGSHLFC